MATKVKRSEVFYTHILDNGIKVIFYPLKNYTAHCGLLINTGTRDELEGEEGMAHFLEHLLFKGTRKRKAREVISRIDEVGGELNAYTTKEETFIYATFLKGEFRKAVELIADVCFNSIFPEKEIEKEKRVVLDEINTTKDDPYEWIYDNFEEKIFPNHPLGSNILGTKKTVKSFTQKKIQNFVTRTYNTDEMVLAVAGNIPYAKVIKYSEMFLGEIPANHRKWNRIQAPDTIIFNEKSIKNYNATHCLIGGRALSRVDKNRIKLVLLNNIIGGPAMNSLLNLEIREKYGLGYHVESEVNSYCDTGVWSIYLSTQKMHLDKSLSLVHKILNQVKMNKISETKLQKYKKQMLGQLAISLENPSRLLNVIAKSYLTFGRLDTMSDLILKVEAITSQDLIEIANKIYNENNFNSLIFESKY